MKLIKMVTDNQNLEAMLRSRREGFESSYAKHITCYVNKQAWSSVAANEIGDRFSEILSRIDSLKEGKDIDSADRLRLAAIKALIKRLREYPVNPKLFIPAGYQKLYAQAQLEHYREKHQAPYR